MIGFVIIAIVAVMLLGVVFKLLKVAIIVAVAIGGVMLVKSMLANKRIK